MNIKRYMLLGLFLLLVPMALGEITITLPEKDSYALGEKVKPEISVKEDQNYNGFFKLSLKCNDYNLQYYTLPLSIEEGVRTVVDAAELTLFGSMTGMCRVKAAFDKGDGAHISSTSSAEFQVNNDVKIILESELKAKPGEEIRIVADVSKGSNQALTGNAEIHFNNKKTDVEVIEGRLGHIINIESDAEPGQTALTIKVSDEFGNKGEKTVNLEVLQIPTRIENQILENIILPGEDFKAKILLYDHKSNLIEGSLINLKVFDTEENQLTETELQSGEEFSMVVDNGFEPGVYSILTEFGDVKQQSEFTIKELKKISMKQEGNLVHVENIGNVDYNDETTIVLESDDKNYLINKKLKLEPLEKITIDLSKEVPQGTYDITLPEEAVEEEEESKEVLGPVNVIKDVPIEDNRNVIKKTASGLGAVTGAAISTAGYVASKPLLASTVLITIILGIMVYYGRGAIINRVKRKKEGDTSELFGDFEYDENSKR